MKAFDFHRFSVLLRCHFREQRRQTINMLFVIIMVMLFIDLITTEGIRYSDAVTYRHLILESMDIKLLSLMFFMLAGAAGVFQNMRDERPRRAFLLLPASSLEKYAMRLFMCIVVYGIIGLTGIVVGDLLRMAVAPVFLNREPVSGITTFFSVQVIPRLNAGGFSVVALALSELMLLHSTYVLGGTVFRRQAFALTSVVILLSVYLLAYVWHAPSLMDNPNVFSREGVTPWYYLTVVTAYALSLLFYWLAYRVFSHTQLVTRKWLNL